jgi:hypothetical protein
MTDDPVHASPAPLSFKARQDAYRLKRRAWARRIGQPYPEDGGETTGRGHGTET